MKETSGALLEFESLRALLGRYVASPLGRRELDAIAPLERDEAEAALAESAEAIEYLRVASLPQRPARGAAVRLRFEDLPDTHEAIHKLAVEGAVLDGVEILALVALLDRAVEVRLLLSAAADRYPRLAAGASAIGEFRPLLADLAGKILPDGSVADHASVALARLRRDLERQRKLIEESLERFLRAHRDEGVLQEDFVTIRNERFVVPLIAGQKRRIAGVVHGASATGHTLFLEPFETIELNNELVSLTEEELRETHRILRELTSHARVHAPAISSAAGILARIEIDFAKARFALDFDCTIPRFSPPGERRLKLRDARHPLLADVLRRQGRPIVAVSLELDERTRTLLVSGPNTGGKTVTLKTAGLLALMAQCGLPVPASEAELPLFESILADIGDNQSIEESLSTFSAHVARIRTMLDSVTADSLVLLDELGRATDPEEGGALGAALIERFRSTGAFTLATTHLVALKVYGATTPGVLNRSMGFDEQTLEPTFVLRFGSPGKSAALDIAARLGLPGALIEQARERMTAGARDLNRLLVELEKRIDECGLLRARLQSETEALVRQRAELGREWGARETAKLKEIERRAELAIEKFEAQTRELIERLTAEAGARKSTEAARRAARVKTELRHDIETTALAADDESRQGKLVTPRIEPGVRVRLKGVREPARVRRLLAHGIIEVESGFLKLQAPADDVLEVLPDPGEGRSLPAGVRFEPGPRANTVSREINVIGQRAEEACAAVDKFLDSAALASVDRVRIIHGHGMGILKKAVAGLLTNHPHVEKFHEAAASEGGAGATIAEMKN